MSECYILNIRPVLVAFMAITLILVLVFVLSPKGSDSHVEQEVSSFFLSFSLSLLYISL